ncbi:hypothetical protein B9Z55_022329 [Caenorhabditis nigoni]|uniref:SPK domain-containing protein n=2 Tax=Caenorhabditis nigoni TaxID=1611254 RepID=A0A2G5SK45_9PELO|nr:hypothetical protein B9Z55_022329 [Caenorhabditis nigoni]
MDTTLSESEEEEQLKKSKKVMKDKEKVICLQMKPLERKKFDGSNNPKYDDWKTIFMKGFGKDPRMTKLNKQIQLKGLVSRVTEDLLEGGKLEERDYGVAWTILDDNFEKPARILLALERKFNRIKIESTAHESTTRLKKGMNKEDRKQENLTMESIQPGTMDFGSKMDQDRLKPHAEPNREKLIKVLLPQNKAPKGEKEPA